MAFSNTQPFIGGGVAFSADGEAGTVGRIMCFRSRIAPIYVNPVLSRDRDHLRYYRGDGRCVFSGAGETLSQTPQKQRGIPGNRQGCGRKKPEGHSWDLGQMASTGHGRGWFHMATRGSNWPTGSGDWPPPAGRGVPGSSMRYKGKKYQGAGWGRSCWRIRRIPEGLGKVLWLWKMGKTGSQGVKNHPARRDGGMEQKTGGIEETREPDFAGAGMPETLWRVRRNRWCATAGEAAPADWKRLAGCRRYRAGPGSGAEQDAGAEFCAIYPCIFGGCAVCFAEDRISCPVPCCIRQRRRILRRSEVS